jgi:outer membrane immunogenic protein
VQKILLAIVAGIFAVPAMAADLPVYKAPPPVAVAAFSWTGFYVGANIGYSDGRSNNVWDISAANIIVPNAQCGPADVRFCVNGQNSNKLTGAIGGFQAGYNWQSGRFLAGVETDWQISDQKADQLFNFGFINAGNLFPGAFVSGAYTQRLQWLGTLRGRVGITADRVLFYGTGGLAYGQVKIDGSATSSGFFTGIPGAPACTGPGPFGSTCQLANWSNSSTKVGWTVGGGLEAAISNGWTVKVEYLYVDLGTVRTSFATLPGCYGTPIFPGGICTGVSAGTGNINSRITDNIVRVGFNYRFGGGAVVAKY